MKALREVLHKYWLNDMHRLFWLRQNLFWIPYYRYEYTRLSSIRAEMDLHKTYKKETVLDEDKKESFIWSYVIRPVRK